MRAFITGATGFIGGALLAELLATGWEVRALVRPTSNRQNLAGHCRDFELVVGDLRDPAVLQRGLAGCDALFHVAARYSLWNPHPREIYADNVEGTRNVLEAARRREVDRIVYTSTVGTMHIPPDGKPGDESRMLDLSEVQGHYKRSKLLAEKLVRQFAAEGLPVVIVHPSAPVGARDVKPTPTGQMILDYLMGKMPAYTETGLNIVGVEDVARGHLLAFHRGRPGEGYILGGENMTLLEIFRALARITGIPAPRFKIPRGALMPIAAASECLAWALGRPPRVSWEAVRLAGKFMFFTSAKAEKELGYRPGPALMALERAVRWFESRMPGNGVTAGAGRVESGVS
jgi:dihydroflavonol-4-reductase